MGTAQPCDELVERHATNRVSASRQRCSVLKILRYVQDVRDEQGLAGTSTMHSSLFHELCEASQDGNKVVRR
jgi:glycerol-3-phosphate cytidylyltransferase-like family protein